MRPKPIFLLAAMILAILCSFFVIAPEEQKATDTVDNKDPSSINNALQQGNAGMVAWGTINYADPSLNYGLINQYSNLVDGKKYLESFGAKGLVFSKDQSSLEWGADGTIAVGMDKLTAEAYKSFPSGTEVDVANDRIEVVYPAGKEVSVKNADSAYVIDGKNGVKVDGIIIKGKLQAKDGALWLEPGQKIELNGFIKEIENHGESAERITFNDCGQGGICVYDNKVLGDAKGIRITNQDGLQLNIQDATFNVGTQLNQNEIIKLQELLNKLGYTDFEGKALVADGVPGERTKFALKKYQQYLINGRHYLSGSREDQEAADGIPGEKTIQAINRDIGPSIYIDGTAAYIKNSDEFGSEFCWISDEHKISVGYIYNNYLLSTPYYKDRVYGNHNSMPQAEASGPFMKNYQEGKYNSVQDVINDAYQQAGWKGGSPTKEQIEKADKLIQDNTHYTLTDLTKLRGESPDKLFKAPVTYSDEPPAVEASSGARAGAKKEAVNTMDMLEWSVSKRDEWLPANTGVTSKPELRKGKKGNAQYHIAFDISAPENTPVKLDPINKAFGEGAYGIVESTGTDKDMKDAGNHVFVGFYYADGEPVLNDEGEHLGKLTMHHNKIAAAQGSILYPNQEYATVGQTGHATGPHVHEEYGSKRALVDDRTTTSLKGYYSQWKNNQK